MQWGLQPACWWYLVVEVDWMNEKHLKGTVHPQDVIVKGIFSTEITIAVFLC